MNDFTKMTALDAVTWYAENANMHLDVDVLSQLVGYGITDTDQIIEISRTEALTDLAAVPGLEPTLANLRLLAQVGPQVLAKDPENVTDWAGLLDHPQAEGGFEVLEPFIASGRGPVFARQVLDLFQRNADAYPDAEVYDLSLPYAELADMVDHNLKSAERGQWEAAGFNLADAIKLRGDGLTLPRIVALQHHGIPRDQWAKYVPIPMEWLDHTPSTYRASRKAPDVVLEPFELPDGYDLDLLLTLHTRGWMAATIDMAGWRTRAIFNQWQVYANDKAHTLTRDQVQRLLDAKLTNVVATKYYTESRAGIGANDRKAPGPLLRYERDVPRPELDTLLGQWIELAAAGVRPSHLSEYRWVGCTNYAQILEAVAVGITPKRAKELRAKHGVKSGRQVNDTLRINSFTALLAHHNDNEGSDSSAPREDEVRQA